MPPSLSALPIEVIGIITGDLDRKDLSAVRLVDKELHQKTLYHFGRVCFNTLKTDLSKKSVQRLQSISQAEHLNHHVQTLTIKEQDDGFGRGFCWYWAKESRFLSHVDAQRSAGAKILQDALKNLVNCQHFQICGLDEEDNDYEPGNLPHGDVIGILFNAIAEIGLPIKSFHLELRSEEDQEYETMQMQLFQDQPAFIAAWKNIEELSLELGLIPTNFPWVRDLVLYATNLKKLSLDFFSDDITPYLDTLLSSPGLFQGLQELSLENMDVTFHTLSTVLVRCRSNLRKLSFASVYITSGTWAQVLAELRTFQRLEDIQVLWPKEWKNGLLCIHLFALEHDSVVPNSGGRTFKMWYEECNLWKGMIGASFHSRVGMDEALKILAEIAQSNIN